MDRNTRNSSMTIAKMGALCLVVLIIALGIGVPVAAEITNDKFEDITTAAMPNQTKYGGEDLGHDDKVNVNDQITELITLKSASGMPMVFDETMRDDSHVMMASNDNDLPSYSIANYKGMVESDFSADPTIEHSDTTTDSKPSIKDGASVDVTKFQMAQFAVRPGSGTRREVREEAKLPSALKYNYAYGFEMEAIYMDNQDLNDSLKDESFLLAPTVFGLFTYRPNAWLETTLEMTLEQLIGVKEEDVVQLPDGTLQPKEKKRLSLLVDQALVKLKNLGPFEVTVGRQNYEDIRLWLYDAALDAFLVKLSLGDVHTFASLSREDLVDGELLYSAGRGKTDNYILYSEYRGIEDHKLGAYGIKRDDTEGLYEPLHLGVRMVGRPSDRLNYWTDLGMTFGKDEDNNDLEGYGFDVGATYRFLSIPLQPSITLSYAFGSGDDDPNDKKNHEFRQTGLQSNEGRFGGVTQFKYYGEMFDPELTNLKVFTAGLGFRLAAGAFVDIVYHNYRQDEITDEFTSSNLTALINQDNTHLSKDVGNEVDIILGFRNLFGLRRLGLEFRLGWFFPGDAYRIPEGDPDNPTFRKADQGISALGVIIL